MLPVLDILAFFVTCAVSTSFPLHARENSTTSLPPIHGSNFQVQDNIILDLDVLLHSPPRNNGTFAPTHGTDFQIHDPTILLVGNTYYAYSVGTHIRIHEAPNLAGPWKESGTVLGQASVIQKGARSKPWAPTILQVYDTFYCYYAVSEAGSRDSAIGVATSSSPGPGGWTDHGAIIQTGTGNGSQIRPMHSSNAIDPSVQVQLDGNAYLTYGSFWSGIWHVPLNHDLVSANFSAIPSDARHLAQGQEPDGSDPVEGAFVSYHGGWYYLWFSHGECCDFDVNNLPPPGEEYTIRVGRSRNIGGPYVDKSGKDLVDGGYDIVYGSNRDVYAPGGQGILREGFVDILYYHYLNTTIGYAFNDTHLGFNALEYVDGWPVAI